MNTILMILWIFGFFNYSQCIYNQIRQFGKEERIISHLLVNLVASIYVGAFIIPK